MAPEQTDDQKAWPKNRISVLYELNREAMLYWHRMLRASPHAQAYLETRGFPDAEDVAEKYKLGYAPGRGDGYPFVPYILSRSDQVPGVKDRDDLERALVAAGLARRANNGGIYDFFFGRLIFPISDRGSLDQLGTPDVRVVGFGGRHVPRDDDGRSKEPPKWLNTPETASFRKRSVLYGGSWGSGKIMAQRECILLEGYCDVIQAREAGFENAVATLGTSLTEEHVSWFPASIKRKRMRVVISTDDDTAGRRAAARAAKLIFALRNEDVEVRIARPPDGLDPDDLILQRGASALRECIDDAMTPVARMLADLEEGHPSPTLTDMVTSLQAARGILSPAPEDREEDVQFVHAWLGRRYGVHMPHATLRRLLADAGEG